MWGVYAPVIALVAVKRGEADSAARLLGAGDAQLARSGLGRLLLERNAEQQVGALPTKACGERSIAAWIAEGAAMDEEAFARLAVGEGRRS